MFALMIVAASVKDNNPYIVLQLYWLMINLKGIVL